jgi:hypothetical protein
MIYLRSIGNCFLMGELAKLLLDIGANVPMKDFNSYLIEEVKEETLIELCSGSPFSKEYLLGHHWCYSEYTRLLEKNHITLKNELEFINALDEFLDSSMKLTSGTLAERSKVRNDMFNKLVTKENMIRWIKNGYKFIIKGIEEE